MSKSINVRTPSGDYEVLIGSKLLGNYNFKWLVQNRQILIVKDSMVPNEILETLRNALSNSQPMEIKILEIGSFAGASAAAFVKYFNKAKVFCFDINISNFKYYSKNIEVFGEVKNYGCSTHPHNTYFQLLSETGIIGFDFLCELNFQAYRTLITTPSTPTQVS